MIFASVYTLWMYKRVFFGKITNPAVSEFKEIHGSEYAVLVILAVFVIGIGIYPLPLLNVFHASVGHLLTLSQVSKLGVVLS